MPSWKRCAGNLRRCPMKRPTMRHSSKRQRGNSAGSRSFSGTNPVAGRRALAHDHQEDPMNREVETEEDIRLALYRALVAAVDHLEGEVRLIALAAIAKAEGRE